MSRTALYQRTYRSNHRRSDCKLCHAGRYYYRRASCPDRLCRPQGHRADHRTEAARGLSESRVPFGARFCRYDTGEKRSEACDRPDPLYAQKAWDDRCGAGELRQESEPEAQKTHAAGSESFGHRSKAGEHHEKTAWDTVLLSRKADRPTALDYINAVFDEFIEFHGDRYFKDDGAIVGGIAMFHGMPVTVIGQQKGKNTKDNIKRNFGMPSPDGYRKALRLMKQAEAFGRPIVCFVDTPGAFCGLEAEERGQGEAIARNLFEMSDLKVPILSIVIGEGGSGGALAMAVADEVWMLENAIYSILSPEGFASILYKDSKKAPEAAEVMKVTAADLKKLGLIEQIIPEKDPASTDTLYRIAGFMDQAMAGFFETYQAMTEEELAEHRYQRFRRM